MKGRVHELGLKGAVRVNKAGCLDACAQGPTLVVYPDYVWYAPKTEEDMEEILTEHIQNSRPVDRLIIPFKPKG
jgi:(2Fe-2S) ferredoxin